MELPPRSSSKVNVLDAVVEGQHARNESDMAAADAQHNRGSIDMGEEEEAHVSWWELVRSYNWSWLLYLVQALALSATLVVLGTVTFMLSPTYALFGARLYNWFFLLGAVVQFWVCGKLIDWAFFYLVSRSTNTIFWRVYFYLSSYEGNVKYIVAAIMLRAYWDVIIPRAAPSMTYYAKRLLVGIIVVAFAEGIRTLLIKLYTARITFNEYHSRIERMLFFERTLSQLSTAVVPGAHSQPARLSWLRDTFRVHLRGVTGRKMRMYLDGQVRAINNVRAVRRAAKQLFRRLARRQSAHRRGNSESYSATLSQREDRDVRRPAIPWQFTQVSAFAPVGGQAPPPERPASAPPAAEALARPAAAPLELGGDSDVEGDGTATTGAAAAATIRNREEEDALAADQVRLTVRVDTHADPAPQRRSGGAGVAFTPAGARGGDGSRPSSGASTPRDAPDDASMLADYPHIALPTSAAAAPAAVPAAAPASAAAAAAKSAAQLRPALKTGAHTLARSDSTQDYKSVGQPLYARPPKPERMLRLEDFAEHLSEEDAQRLMKALDLNDDGAVSEPEFVLGLQGIYRGWESLGQSLRSRESISRSLDFIGSVLFWLVAGLFLLVVFEVALSEFVLLAGSFSLSLSFAFSTAATRLVQSLVFVLVQKPYDVGDRVRFAASADTVARAPAVYVHKVDVYMTTFKTLFNETLYVPNADLSTMHLQNLRRSPEAWVEFIFYVGFRTTAEQINAIEKAANYYVTEVSRDWKKEVWFYIYDAQLDTNRLTIGMWVPNYLSWQDAPVIFRHKSQFIAYLVQHFNALGIDYQLPTQPVRLDKQLGAAEPARAHNSLASAPGPAPSAAPDVLQPALHQRPNALYADSSLDQFG